MRGTPHRLVVAAVVAAIMIMVALMARSDAGPDRIAFPAKFKEGVVYQIADHHDVKQYRELYASAAAIAAAKKGDPLPDGTVLTLVQFKAQVDAQGNPVKDASSSRAPARHSSSSRRASSPTTARCTPT